MTISPSLIPIRVIEAKYNQDIRNYSKTQGGSKEIQKKLREMDEDQIGEFIDQISPFLSEFLQDDYANYMVQTLVSCSNSKQRLNIFRVLE